MCDLKSIFYKKTSCDDEYIVQTEQSRESSSFQDETFQMEQKLIKEGWIEFKTSNIESMREIVYQVVKHQHSSNNLSFG